MATKTANKKAAKSGSPSKPDPESEEQAAPPKPPVDHGDLTEEEFNAVMAQYQKELSEGRHLTASFASWVEARFGWMHTGGQRFQVPGDTPAMREAGQSYRPNQGEAVPDTYS